MNIVFGHCGPSIAYCIKWRLAIRVYSKSGNIWDKKLQIYNSFNNFRINLWRPQESLKIIQYFSFDSFGALPISATLVLPSSLDNWWFKSFSHCFILPHLTKSASNEVFWNFLRPLDRIVQWCVTVPAYDVSSAFFFAHMTHNASDCEFARRVSKFFCGRFSSRSSIMSSCLSTDASGVYTSRRSANFADATTVARSIEPVFGVWFTLVVIVVGNNLITFTDRS